MVNIAHATGCLRLTYCRFYLIFHGVLCCIQYCAVRYESDGQQTVSQWARAFTCFTNSSTNVNKDTRRWFVAPAEPDYNGDLIRWLFLPLLIMKTPGLLWTDPRGRQLAAESFCVSLSLCWIYSSPHTAADGIVSRLSPHTDDADPKITVNAHKPPG